MGKLGQLKRFFIATMLISVVAFNLFSQTTSSNSGNNTVTESSIILSDDVSAGTSFSNDTNQTFKSTSTIGALVRMIIVLIIVLGLIYGVLYFIKKKTNVVKNEDDYLRRAAYLNIAPGKTVEVITLINKAYLIGVTEDNITMLGEIDDEELISAMNLNADKKNNTKKPVSFTEVLDTFLVKSKKKNIFEDTANEVDNIFSKKQEEQNE